jgi:hypothetical protein
MQNPNADDKVKRLQRKLDIAKDTVDSLNSKIRDTELEGLKLAKSLGFDTVYAAQSYIDIADEQVSYKELAGRIDGLQTDLSNERKDNQELRAQVLDLMTERDTLRASNR